MQALYPGNRGLFQRVILVSGAPLNINAVVNDPMTFTLIYANRIGCGNHTRTNFDPEAIMACLRTKDSSLVKETFHNIVTDEEIVSQVAYFDGRIFGPVIDGEFLKRKPSDSLDDENSEELAMLRSLDILTGNVDQEGSIISIYIDSFVTPGESSSFNIVYLAISLDVFSDLANFTCPIGNEKVTSSSPSLYLFLFS